MSATSLPTTLTAETRQNDPSHSAIHNLLHKFANQVINVTDSAYGAVGNGSTDDTAAITSAFESASAINGGTPTGDTNRLGAGILFFPPGDYVMSTGLSTAINLNLVIQGAGPELTRVRVPDDAYFLTATARIESLKIKGVRFYGGKGVLRHTYTEINVADFLEVEDCVFSNYSEVAIGSLSSDFPYWKVTRSVFYGTTTSKGIVHSGDCSGMVIDSCDFRRNRYHIQLALGGLDARIINNTFIRFTNAGGNPALTDIWLIPHSSTVNAGAGLGIISNKFGNENLAASDYRILVADINTGAGTDAFDRVHATTASTGYISGIGVRTNNVAANSGHATGFIYSYTPNLINCAIEEQLWNGSRYPNIVEYDSAVTLGSDRLRESNLIHVGVHTDPFNLPHGAYSNEPSIGVVSDPLGLQSGYAHYAQPYTTGYDPAFASLLSTAVGSFAKSNVTNSSQTDSQGGSEAEEFTFSTSAGVVSATLSVMTPDRLSWLEFEVQAAGSQAMTNLLVDIRIGATICFRRYIHVPTTWQRVRFPYVPRTTSDAQSLQFRVGTDWETGGTDKVQIGRVRVYHANEPVNHLLSALPTSDPSDGVTIWNSAGVLKVASP